MDEWPKAVVECLRHKISIEMSYSNQNCTVSIPVEDGKDKKKTISKNINL